MNKYLVEFNEKEVGFLAGVLSVLKNGTPNKEMFDSVLKSLDEKILLKNSLESRALESIRDNEIQEAIYFLQEYQKGGD